MGAEVFGEMFVLCFWFPLAVESPQAALTYFSKKDERESV